MNAELLYEALNDQHSLEQLNELELDRLVHAHPYFSIGQLLLAKKLKQENDQESYQQQRSRVQTFYRNPWWLYYQLELSDTTTGKTGFYNPDPPASEKSPIFVGTDRWPDLDEVHTSPSGSPEDSGHDHVPAEGTIEHSSDTLSEDTGSITDQTGPTEPAETFETVAPFESIAREWNAGISHEAGEKPFAPAEPLIAVQDIPEVVGHQTMVEHESDKKMPRLLALTEEEAPAEYPLYPTNPPKDHTQVIVEQQQAPGEVEESSEVVPVTEVLETVAATQSSETSEPFEVPPMPVMVDHFIPEEGPALAAPADQPVPVSPEEQPALPGEEPLHTPTEVPEMAPVESPAHPEVEVPASPEQEPHGAPEVSPSFPREVPQETPPEGPAQSPPEEPSETPGKWPSEMPAPTPGPELPSFPEEKPIAAEFRTPSYSVHPASNGPIFEPLYTVDYFASQGIKLSLEDNATDKLSQHLKSFTEWLRTMKRINALEPTREELDTATEAEIQHLASSANRQKEAVVTESMAQVWVHQGKVHKAIEVYHKLSLQHPEKRTYFAAKIEQLNRP